MRNKTVLIVEDYLGLAKAYELLLKDKGYETTIATSAREALQYKERQFTLAVFDGLEGQCFEVIDKIRAERKIILSGDDLIVSRAKKMGLEAYDKLNEGAGILQNV